MKITTSSRLLVVITILFMATTACALPVIGQVPGLGTQPDNQQTLDARTVEAMVTQISAPGGEATQPAPTNPPPPSSTPVTQPTLRPTSTPLPTATGFVLPPVPVIVPTAMCDKGSFVEDVSVPDGTVFAADTSFIKTWKIKNTGTCTWSADYAVVFDSGDAMGGPTSQALKKSVAPGDTVDISITMKAPSKAGTYRGNWRLRNAENVLFGMGSKREPFYVEIKVISVTPIVPVKGYEFTTDYCAAIWTGNDVTLPCNGTDGDSKGFVLYLPEPVFENGYVDNEPALLTNPPKATDGIIRGKFPAYTVKDGDHFRTIIGCQQNAKNCNVRFELSYQGAKGGIQTFKTWNEKFDQEVTKIDEDLSGLAGQNLIFYLTVYANGASDGDRAMWLRPRIVSK